MKVTVSDLMDFLKDKLSSGEITVSSIIASEDEDGYSFDLKEAKIIDNDVILIPNYPDEWFELD